MASLESKTGINSGNHVFFSQHSPQPQILSPLLAAGRTACLAVARASKPALVLQGGLGWMQESSPQRRDCHKICVLGS